MLLSHESRCLWRARFLGALVGYWFPSLVSIHGGQYWGGTKTVALRAAPGLSTRLTTY